MKPIITAVICWPDVRNLGKWSIFWNAWSFSSSCVTVWSLPCSSLLSWFKWWKTSLRKQTAAELFFFFKVTLERTSSLFLLWKKEKLLQNTGNSTANGQRRNVICLHLSKPVYLLCNECISCVKNIYFKTSHASFDTTIPLSSVAWQQNNWGLSACYEKKTSCPVWSLYRTRESNISILKSGVDIRKKEGCGRVNVFTLNFTIFLCVGGGGGKQRKK